MNAGTRNIIIGICGLAIVGSFVAFAATGMYPYTRFRDAEIEEANAQEDLADLFADSQDEPAEQKKIESVNAIGFLPSGPGKASVSVVTISAPALIAMVGVIWWSRRTQAKGSEIAQNTESEAAAPENG